jgi:hypothetical protein
VELGEKMEELRTKCASFLDRTRVFVNLVDKNVRCDVDESYE